MGNDHSNHNKKIETPPTSQSQNSNSRAISAFNRIANNESTVGYKRFVELFGEDLAKSLWEYLTEQQPKSIFMDQTTFTKHAESLIGMSTDIYVRVCQPVHHLLKVCSDSAGASACEGDEYFIKTLIEDITSGGDSVADMVSWKQSTCPKFCHAAQGLVLHAFMSTPVIKTTYDSDILSPLQLWYMSSCLPPNFFPAQNAEATSNVTSGWTPLYTSAMQGISVNRFEKNVFDYRGATVSIFQLTDRRLVVLATDKEWRHGSTRFGGPTTTYFELFPDLKKIEAANSIYCNFKVRSAAFGLSFQEVLKIDKEMSNVAAIEVWGCAPASTLADQQKLKQWQSKQTERNKKVPLPGNWDDNPDKSILEMAGIQFSNERMLMEKESMQKNRERDVEKKNTRCGEENEHVVEQTVGRSNRSKKYELYIIN